VLAHFDAAASAVFIFCLLGVEAQGQMSQADCGNPATSFVRDGTAKQFERAL
jgi:hypothetical protein